MRHDEYLAAMKHRERKEIQNERIQQKKAMIREQTWCEAQQTKQVKEETRLQKQALLENHEIKAQHQNMLIRQQHLDTQTKKEQTFMDKQQKARELLEEKMRNEESTRMQHE